MTGRRHSPAYWVAVVMAAACVATIILHHTPRPWFGKMWKFEIAGISLSWITGGAAIFAILVHELMDSVVPKKPLVRRESRVERNEKPLNQRA